MGAYTLREPQHRMDFFMDNQQTIYKLNKGYHDLHVKELQEHGYIIIKETDEYTLIAKPGDQAPHNRQTDGGGETTASP